MNRYRASQSGVAMLEWLVATPLCMIVGLGALQWALVLQARHGLDYAVEQGARYAAVQYGRGEAINKGLAKGLQPFWLSRVPQEAQIRLKSALSAGWLSWRRISPGPEAFADFAQPARTKSGLPIRGDKHIPNDNLRYRSEVRGAQSKLSVQDANRILIEMRYGIPLKVPVVNGFIVRVMEIVDGCKPPEALLLSMIRLGEPKLIAKRAWTCPMYRAPDTAGGRSVWRLPVRVRAERWMQSPLRQSSSADSKYADKGGTAVPVVAPIARRGPDVLTGPPPSPPGLSPAPSPLPGPGPGRPTHPPGTCPSPT